MPVTSESGTSLTRFYFTPKGRASRKHYWLWFHIPWTIIFYGGFIALWFALTVSITAENPDASTVSTLVIALIVFCVAAAWVWWCVIVKRWHDRGKSAWWVLILFIPVVGSIWGFIELGLLAGDPYENQYGPPV